MAVLCSAATDLDTARRRLEKRRDDLLERLRGLGNLMRGNLYTTDVYVGERRAEEVGALGGSRTRKTAKGRKDSDKVTARVGLALVVETLLAFDMAKVIKCVFSAMAARRRA